jgi:hypothetical protein
MTWHVVTTHPEAHYFGPGTTTALCSSALVAARLWDNAQDIETIRMCETCIERLRALPWPGKEAAE